MKNKITQRDIINLLIDEHGYKEYEEEYSHPYLFKCLLQKRVNSDSVCETNNKLNIDINVSKMDLGSNVYESYDVKIVAEKNGLWWNLSCYSMNRGELLEKLTEVENTLIKLFNSINQTGIYSPDEYFD